MQSCAARAATRAALAVARPRSILLTGGARSGPVAAAAAAAAAAASLPLGPLLLRASGPRSAAAVVVARAAASTSTAPTTTTTTTKNNLPLPTPTSPEGWTIRMLYDGECALCMKEVEMLRKRDAAGAGTGRIDFVDIAGEGYRAEDNCGIDYERAMQAIHAIRPNGEILTGIAVFRALYEAVGLGWVYAVTSNPSVEKAANAVYGFWAKYRTNVTGREDMAAIFEARRRRMAAAAASGGGEIPGSECRVDGSGCGDEANGK